MPTEREAGIRHDQRDAETVWRRSTRCASQGCIEVDMSKPVRVRQSKDPDFGHLAFATSEWTNFIESVKADEFGPHRR